VLVSIDELRRYMDISFSPKQEDAATYVLEGLQSELEIYLGRPIELTQTTEEHVIQAASMGMPTASFFYDQSIDTTLNTGISITQPPITIYLRNTPVVSVTSVTITNTTGDVLSQTEGIDYVVQRYGVDCYRGYPNDVVSVNYEGGLDGDSIKAFRLMILRAASREMQNMHDDVVGIKDLNTRNVAPLQTGFLDSELRAMKPYVKKRIAG
jgi:hypothetical protein